MQETVELEAKIGGESLKLKTKGDYLPIIGKIIGAFFLIPPLLDFFLKEISQLNPELVAVSFIILVALTWNIFANFNNEFKDLNLQRIISRI